MAKLRVSQSPRWFKYVRHKLKAAGIDDFDQRVEVGFEHRRRYKTIAIFFPYRDHIPNLETLLRVCRELKLNVVVSDTSTYTPETIMIAIFKDHDKERFTKLLAWMERKRARGDFEEKN